MMNTMKEELRNRRGDIIIWSLVKIHCSKYRKTRIGFQSSVVDSFFVQNLKLVDLLTSDGVKRGGQSLPGLESLILLP